MSTFKIKIETGLELEIEGTKDAFQSSAKISLRSLADAFRLRQLYSGTASGYSASFVEHPAADNITVKGESRLFDTTSAWVVTRNRQAFDWTHDVQQWGHTSADWNPLQKSIGCFTCPSTRGSDNEPPPNFEHI